VVFFMEERFLILDVFSDVEFLVPRGCIFTFTKKPDIEVVVSVYMAQS